MKLVQALLGFTLLASLWCESHQTGYFAMGPYDITLLQMSACEDQGMNLSKANVTMYLSKSDGTTKRKRLHRGSFSFPFTKEETDRMELQADLYLKRSNNFLLTYKMRDSFCYMTTVCPFVYQRFREAIGLPPEGCYIPYGNYTFEDMDLQLSTPAPMLEYGTKKVIFNYLIDKKVYACNEVLYDITPKK